MNTMFSHSAAPAAGLSTPLPDTACALMVAASLLLADLERGRAIDAKALRAATLRAIAAELTRMRVPTARGGAEWSAQQVSNILKRTT